MRLSDAEREGLYGQLKRHAAEGRLDIAELERRVAVVASATTFAEASAALAELPSLGGNPSPDRERPRRGRGHGHVDSPSSDWQPTAERFRDPRTGQVMRVWVDSAAGRHYVPDE